MTHAPLPALGQATGTVASVRGSVVDVHFEASLPAIHNILLAGAKDQIVVEVLAQQDAHHVGGIALTPRKGLARGIAVSEIAEMAESAIPKWFGLRLLTVGLRPILRPAELKNGSREEIL